MESWAKVIKDSVSTVDGTRLTTLVLRYPRFVHAQAKTHRMLNIDGVSYEVYEDVSIMDDRNISKNAASSRAIPVHKVISSIEEDTAYPIYYGVNQSGMQAYQEGDRVTGKWIWDKAARSAIASAKEFIAAKFHKQIANRILEPYQYITVICTATEWDNFFALRLHDAAQPEIQKLAKDIQDALDGSVPVPLNPGEWHTPFSDDNDPMLSAARCARVSYLNHDQTEPDYIKDMSLANVLWEHGHCYTEQTQILTKEGFIDFKDLNEDTLVASVDSDTLEFQHWQKPNFIVNKYYKGNVYSYPSLGLEVTEDHTMIGHICDTSRSRQATLSTVKYKANDTTSNRFKKATMGEVEARLPSSCYSTIIENADYHLGQLIGFYIGDGFFSSSNTQSFRLVKGRKREYLEAVLGKLGVEYTIDARDGDTTTSGSQVYTYKFNAMIHGCGVSANTKTIPDVQNMDTIRGIFDGLKNSDGSIKRNTWTYSTTSEALKNRFLALAPLVGINAIETKPMNGAYCISVRTKGDYRINDTRTEGSKVNIKEYSGRVYCASVDGGALVVRTKNGNTLVSGNCSPFEHQATPSTMNWTWDHGVTHMDRNQKLWSGNLKSWIQYRHYKQGVTSV